MGKKHKNQLFLEKVCQQWTVRFQEGKGLWRKHSEKKLAENGNGRIFVKYRGTIPDTAIDNSERKGRKWRSG